MNTCKTCKWWREGVDEPWQTPPPNRFGRCLSDKFCLGYDDVELESDMVHVENDQGWGFWPGKDFGCVHWKKRLL